MSEAMALESLAEEWLRFQGFWTQTRVPFRLCRASEAAGPSSDIDVIGVKLNSGRPRVVAVEVKGHGSPDDYFDYSKGARRKAIDELCREKKMNIRFFESSDVARTRLGISRIHELRLVLPGRIGPEGGERSKLESRIRDHNKLPFELRIFAIHEMIGDLVKRVDEDKDKRRKRYADTALEMIRWTLRAKGKVCFPGDGNHGKSSAGHGQQ